MELYAAALTNFFLWSMVLLLAFFALSLISEVGIRQAKSSVESKITSYEEELKSAANQKLSEEVLALNNQIATIKSLESQHYYWSNVVEEIGNISPADLQIDILTMDRATGHVEIMGQAGTRTSVLEFWANVKKSNMFKDINFPLSNLERANNGSFTYTFNVVPEKAKTE